MDLLDLAKEAGLSPLKVAQTNGGEYICACPSAAMAAKEKSPTVSMYGRINKLKIVWVTTGVVNVESKETAFNSAATSLD